MNRNILKKIVAIVTSLTVLAWLAPSSVQGITVAELEAQIAALMAQLTQLQVQLTQLQGGEAGTPSACSGITFSASLKQGSSGNDVKCLQAILNQSADTQVAASGAGSPGSETTYFGPLTKAAVIKFQEKYASEILATYGLTKGTGFVGNTTMAKLNTLTGGVPAGCECTSWVTGACASGVNAGKKVQTRTCTPAACSTETQYVTDATCAVGGENKVSLAADTPADSTVAKGAQDVIFAKLNFCAAAEANTVSKIVLTRGGIAADADISYVKLYEGATQVGGTQALNSTTHKATFASLTWTIPANSCKVLTVKGSISATATQGDTVKFLINSASDITSTVALDGVFPISSAGKTIAGISTGLLEISTTTPSGGSVIAGAVEQEIAGFNLYASATEAVSVHSVKVTQVGSVTDSDVSNIKLFYGSTQIGSTVPALTNGKATFDLSSSPFEILAGGTKALKVTVDLGSSTGIKNRTIAFEIADNTSVTAYGANSGGSVVTYGATVATDLWPQNSADVTISLGTLTITKDESNSPSAQDYAKGTSQNSMIAFKFSTGANEGVRITQIKLQEANTVLQDSDVSNVTLYDAATGAQLKDTAGNPVPATGMVSGWVTFGSYTTGLDTTGLFDIAKSSNKVIIVKTDVPTGASSSDAVLGFKINNPTTDIKADGLSSANDLGTAEINGGTSTALPTTLVLHDIIAQGTLTVQTAANSPAAATYALGATDYEFAKFDFISVGEDIVISQLNILFATSSDLSTTTGADAADINNVRLYDGDTLLKTDTTISSGKAEFGINLTVPKNTTKTIRVVGDIPVDSDAAYLQAHIDSDSYITAAGASSAQTITAVAASWSVYGNLMTKGLPGLVVKAATTPISQTYIKNTTAALFTSLFFTASTTEDVKITKIKITAGATTSATVADGYVAFTGEDVDAVQDLLGNISLFDGATQVGSTVSSLTNGALNTDYADFTGLSLIVPKGTTKVIDVKAKILNSTGTSLYFYLGIATSSDNSQITAAGTASGQEATVVVGDDDAGTVGKGMVLGSSGTLTVTNDVNRPISAQILEGKTGTSLGKWKFAATNENILISKLVFDVFHSVKATGTSVGYAATIEDDLGNWATNSVSTTTMAFDYSIDNGATSTCFLWWGQDETGIGTSSDALIAVINSNYELGNGSSTCSNEVRANDATTTDGALTLYASSSAGYSLRISDHTDNMASSVARILHLGLKYGGTESVGTYAGLDNNVVAGKVGLYYGDTLLKETGISSDVANQVIFNFASGEEVEIPYPGSKILTLKVDTSAYTDAVEGSTLQFALGTSTNTVVYTTNYVVAKGKSSGGTLGVNDIMTTSNATTGQMISSLMYLYATKPTVSLNSASPSGAKTPASNQEVFRFDVAAPDASQNVSVNAIRFTISTYANASSSVFERTYKLYKSTDPNTVLGIGSSYANATDTDSTGWVTIYPDTALEIGANSAVTYILKADTSGMETDNLTAQQLTISIEDGDFYWDDSLAVNGRDKVLNLPVTGSQLTY